MTSGRWIEFFEDSALPNAPLSMTRLVNFTASVGIISALAVAVWAAALATTESSVMQAWNAANNFSIILAGLGGFTYVGGRTADVYQRVRIAQAEQGIPATPPPVPPGPTTTINVKTVPDNQPVDPGTQY